MTAIPNKDTIYIDIDDEITGIIDKLRGSDGKVVALVLPKRAAVLQSIVNMRLLKRAADEAKKHVVLITSEAGLLPLAGVAGVHVAKTLTSRPEIPNAPATDDNEEMVEEEPGEGDDKGEVTAATAGAMAVGALAGLPPKDDVETVELDNEETPEDADADADKTSKKKATKPPTAKKDKKLHVPNFERFRLLLILGALILIVVIVGIVLALNVLPKATIDITTDATNVNADLNLNLSTAANSLNTANNTVPATLAQQQKTYTQQVTTTGQQNEGTEATGSVTMSAQECGSPQPANDVPAGTGVSANGLTYITQQDTSFTVSKIKNGCIYFNATGPTSITAQSAGSSYNTDASSFTVAGRPDVSATVDSAPSGGTDNIVQIVSQTDIDNAKSKISTSDPSIKQTLESQLKGQGLYPIVATYSAGTPTVTTSANVGDAATSVTVTEVVTYTMFGVQQSDLKTLIDTNVDGQIDTSKQSILSEGLSNATFSVASSNSTSAQISIQAVATAGPQLDIASIKQQVVGQKSGDVKSLLEANPDVTGVTVKLSPFWVTTVPKKTAKITVDIAKPTTTASNNGNNP